MRWKYVLKWYVFSIFFFLLSPFVCIEGKTLNDMNWMGAILELFALCLDFDLFSFVVHKGNTHNGCCYIQLCRRYISISIIGLCASAAIQSLGGCAFSMDTTHGDETIIHKILCCICVCSDVVFRFPVIVAMCMCARMNIVFEPLCVLVCVRCITSHIQVKMWVFFFFFLFSLHSQVSDFVLFISIRTEKTLR